MTLKELLVITEDLTVNILPNAVKSKSVHTKKYEKLVGEANERVKVGLYHYAQTYRRARNEVIVK